MPLTPFIFLYSKTLDVKPKSNSLLFQLTQDNHVSRSQKYYFQHEYPLSLSRPGHPGLPPAGAPVTPSVQVGGVTAAPGGAGVPASNLQQSPGSRQPSLGSAGPSGPLLHSGAT